MYNCVNCGKSGNHRGLCDSCLLLSRYTVKQLETEIRRRKHSDQVLLDHLLKDKD